jgi:hypothetical protein
MEVTLVSRDNFFLFTPMLHEVAASDIDLTHIVREEVPRALNWRGRLPNSPARCWRATFAGWIQPRRG